VPKTYDPRYYGEIKSGSRRSAEAIVPIVLALVKPTSVVDVGCGAGTWSRVFLDARIPDVLGIDGRYVDTRTLQIPPANFKPHDLREPLQLDRRFDLAISLEVAEHLPASYADQFVATLVRYAPVILFSAAIPSQGGQGHVNEQWPGYWVQKFGQHGYLPIDCIRPRVWDRNDVEWWYAQNALLYTTRDRIDSDPALYDAWSRTNPEWLAFPHPRNYLLKAWQRHNPMPADLVQMAMSMPARVQRFLNATRSSARSHRHY
jgi:SAM-dependent methyltransferase